MANVFWNVTTNGNWDDATNWSPQVSPGAGDDAVLGVTGFAVVQPYTVTVRTAINPNSITISDAQAILSVTDNVTVAVAHDVTNTGDIEAQGASVLNVGGNLANLASPQGNGLVDIDTNGSGGGSATVTGTLQNATRVNIGSGSLGAPVTVTVGALQNTGSLYVYGNTAAGSTDRATLDVLTAAPTNWTGFIETGGDALVEYTQGAIQSIAAGGEIRINGTTSFFANAGATARNSALDGLSGNAGDLELQDGASASLSGDLNNSGTIYIDNDTDYGLDPNGGSTLAITGALTNSGRIGLGNAGLGASVTLSAASLDNTGGSISLVGDNAKGAEATLDIAGAAPATLTGFYDLGGRDSHGGNSLLEFGSGKITSIASGATLYLANPTSFVADSDDLTHDSALTQLSSNAGDLELQDAAAPLHLTGDLTNTGTIYIDTNTDYGLDPNGGSSLTIDGALVNNNRLAIGNAALGANSTVTAASLDNTGGTITLVGDNAKGTTATLDITGAAPTTLTGYVELGGRDSHGGNSLLEFGSGKITSIASGATLYLANPTSFVADSDDLTHNSALSQLSSNAGDFELQDAAAPVHITGNLLNTGTIQLDTNSDYGLDPNGGSELDVDGTLTNDDTINVGMGIIGAQSLLSVGALVNNGTINLYGGKAEAELTVNTAAPTTWASTLNMNVGTVLDTPTGPAALIYKSGSIQTIAASGSIYVWGQAYVADASDPTSNGALSGLSSIAGTLSIDFGASVTINGDVAVTGLLGVDEHQFDGFDNSGGSTLHVTGTLTNSATVDIGNGVLSGPAVMTVGGLVNTGTINIATSSNQTASLTVGSAAPATWDGALNVSGLGSLVYASGSIQTIASDGSIALETGAGYIADASDTTHNGALSGLQSIAGSLSIGYGAQVTTNGGLGVSGTLGVDDRNGSGKSALTVKGTLNNSGTVNVGSFDTEGAATLAVDDLVNSGTINLKGGAGAATINVAAAAPTTWAGTLNVDVGTVLGNPSGPASLVFASGSISSIAAGADIALFAADAYVANAADPTHDSALSGLTSNAGSLYLDFGASAALNGDLANSGTLGVDNQVFDGFDNSGGSGLTIAGALTNSGTVQVGNYGLTSSDTFTAASIANQSGGSFTVTGSGSAAGKVVVAGAIANAGNWNVNTSSAESAGSLVNTGVMNINGATGLPSSFDVAGATENDDQMTIGAHVAFGASGAFTDAGALTLGGFLVVDDGLEITSTGKLVMQGGEIITPDASSVTLDTGATISGAGSILTALVNNGLVTASGGLLTLGGQLSGAGSLAIGSGGALELADPTAEAVDFGGNVGTLKLKQPGNYTGAISDLVQGDTIDLEGVQATSAKVVGSTLTVTTSGGQTLSYQVSGAGLAADTFALQDDQQGGTNLVLGPPGPTISGAATQTAFLGFPSVLGPLTIADPAIGAGDTLTVTITAQYGTLSATAAGAGTVTGSGGGTLTLTGDLADINTMLAAVTYSGAAAGQTDNVQVTVKDASNATAALTVAVTTDTVPYTDPLINAPVLEFYLSEIATELGGVSVSDPYAQTTDDQLTLVTQSDLNLTATGGPGGDVIGQGTDDLVISGTVAQINSYLSDGVAADSAAAEASAAVRTLANLAGTGPKLQKIEAAGKELLDLIKDILQYGKNTPVYPYNNPVNAAKALAQAFLNFKKVAQGNLEGEVATAFLQPVLRVLIASLKAIVKDIFAGFPDIVAADGSIYQFNAVGEFIYATSADSGDSFQVQVRLQLVTGSTTTSEITEIGAQVGSDRITFGVGRSATVWVNGAPETGSLTNGLALSGGKVQQVGPNSYVLTWNTGETLTVVDEGAYLDLTTSSSEQILGLSGGNFTLPDGTSLPQPITSNELATFANAWRVTQATSLLDYGTNETTATYTDTSFAGITLDDLIASLPSSIIAAARQAVAATGITDAGVVAAMEYDYLASGGDPATLSADAGAYQDVTTKPVAISESNPPPTVLGVIAPVSSVQVAQSGVTNVTFDVYLTGKETTDTVVDYSVVASNDDDFTAADFGGTLPTGSITIAAGQTTGQITVAVPQGALGSLPSKKVAINISSPGGVPLFAPSSVEAVSSATATAPSGNGSAGGGGSGSNPAVPALEYLGTLGVLTQVGDNYTLNLGDIQLGQPLPALQFAIANDAAAPGDQLTGSFTWSTVAGYQNSVDGATTSGASLTSPISAGSSDQALTVTTIQNKFGAQSETITFTPVDTNASGYSQQLAPITLTIIDTLKVPDTIYSSAFGDVHILTYNGLLYNFQAVGEFTLAKSNIAGDSFDIQLRLQPWTNSGSVTYIEQVSASLGADRITFGIPSFDRAASVLVDGQATTLSMADPTLTLAGGTVTELSPNVWKVAWNTGETMTVTEVTSLATGVTFFDVDDSVPYASFGAISGLQGWNEGVNNDFQLPDGTVLQQPLSNSELYTTFANAWRVTQQTSLFDYAPGQTTATFTDTSFPPDPISLDDLPASVVAQAAALVQAAGITDPVLAKAAELDYLATGDPSFIAADANVAQTYSQTVAPVMQPTSTTPAIGVAANSAKVTQAASGDTAVTFTAYLTAAAATATTINYAVAGTAGDLAASLFGAGATGSVTIAAGQTTAQFTIEVPAGALGTAAEKSLEVQISSPGSANPVFAPNAETEIVNATAEPGAAAVAEIAYLGKDGTFTFDAATNTYTLDLSDAPQGSAVTAAQFAVINAAANGADNLAGTFTAPTGQGFVITGDNLASPLAGGQSYQGLYASVNTAELGSNGMTLTFNPTDVNDSGYSQALAPITIKIVDSVVAPAAPRVNTPSTIIFPAVHVGAVVSQHVSVTNTAAAGAANLDVALSSGSDDVVVSGAVKGLAPGATDAADLSVSLDTSTAGAKSGSVTESFASDGAGGASAIAQEQPYIDVFGSVYRLADASIAANPLTVHVGDSGAQQLTITNVDPNDGYSEKLIATVVGTTGGVSAAGTTGDIAAGGDAGIAVNFSTATPGQVGTITLDLQSDGNGVDGLGVTDLGLVTIPVVVTANAVPAAAQFEQVSGGGTFKQNGAAYTLDLGVITAPTTVSLGVLNSATAPADNLSGSFTVSGDSAFVNSGLAAFAGLASGAADTAPTVTLNTGVTGKFSETITLHPVDATSGAALPVETLTITGEVDTATPPPVLTAPSSASYTPGAASAVAGVSIADSNAGATVTVTLSDSDGLLAASATGASVVSGSGTTTLTLSGTVADVNADLATLTDTDSLSRADAILVTASDSFGGPASPALITMRPAGSAPTVGVDPVDGDNVINHAQAQAAVGVGLSGSVSGLAAGATFNVAVADGAFQATYTATVNSTGTGWTATIPESDAVKLPDGSATVTAEVNANVQASETVTVAETLPTLTIDPVTGDNVIDSAEAQAGVALSGAVTGLAPGATFSVSVADGSFSKSYTATVNSAGNGWTATMPAADAATLANGTATVSAQATDAYGNVSLVATQQATVAESGPTVTIDPVSGDNVINSAEAHAAGGVALSGTVSGLAAGATFTVAVVDGAFSASYTATVNSAGTGWTATIPESDAVKLSDGQATVTAEVNANVQASEKVVVAETPPTVSIDAVDANNVINYAEAHAAGGVALSGSVSGLAAGATFQVFVLDGGFSKSYAATVNSAGSGWTATIPEADAITLPDGVASFTAAITGAGGVVLSQATDSVTVAETLPSVSIDPINGDDVINISQSGGDCGRSGGRHAGDGGHHGHIGYVGLAQPSPTTNADLSLSGAVSGLAPGKTFQIAVSDGAFSKSYTATVNAAGTGWTATMPAADVAQLPGGTAIFSATVTDAFGNVSAPAVQNVTVGGGTPVVLSVTTDPPSGHVGACTTVEITLNMSEAVVVHGTPALELNDCGVATYDAAKSTSTSLVFDYTVAAGQSTDDLSIDSVALAHGASVADAAGDVADLTGAERALGLVIGGKPAKPHGGPCGSGGGEGKSGHSIGDGLIGSGWSWWPFNPSDGANGNAGHSSAGSLVPAGSANVANFTSALQCIGLGAESPSPVSSDGASRSTSTQPPQDPTSAAASGDAIDSWAATTSIAAGGELDPPDGASEAISFASQSGGLLLLNDPTSYTGRLFGFDGDEMDVAALPFGGHVLLQHSADGAFKIEDSGYGVAHLNPSDQYGARNFAASSGGGAGMLATHV